MRKGKQDARSDCDVTEEMETTRMNQVEIPEIKNTVTMMKNSFKSLISRGNTTRKEPMNLNNAKRNTKRPKKKVKNT